MADSQLEIKEKLWFKENDTVVTSIRRLSSSLKMSVLQGNKAVDNVIPICAIPHPVPTSIARDPWACGSQSMLMLKHNSIQIGMLETHGLATRSLH